MGSDLGSPQMRRLSLCHGVEIDPTLEGVRRRSTASARSEAEPRTRTTAWPLASAAMCNRPSRSPPPPDRRPLPSVDVRMVGKTRQAGERLRRGRARRIRANGTISGPAVGHRDQAQPPAPVVPSLRAPPLRPHVERKAAALGVPRKRVLGVKVPGPAVQGKSSRAPSPARPSLTLTTPCFARLRELQLSTS
jgi:hypothetical protein